MRPVVKFISAFVITIRTVVGVHVRTSRNEVEGAAEAGVVGLDRVGVQLEDEVA